jgi:hypothetical protein
MSAFCPDSCPDADACVVGYPCRLLDSIRAEIASVRLRTERDAAVAALRAAAEDPT